MDKIENMDAVLLFKSVAPGPHASDPLRSLPTAQDGGTGYCLAHSGGHACTRRFGFLEETRAAPHVGDGIVTSVMPRAGRR